MPRGGVRVALRALAYVVAWAVVAVPAAYLLLLADTRTTVIAGHDVAVSPTVDGHATVDLGAYLPNVRYPTGSRLGVDLVVGKTQVDSYQSLLQRYALIGSHPEGEVAKVTDLVHDMVLANALKGAAIGFVGPGAWLLLGGRRRRELVQGLTRRRVAFAVLGAAVAVAAVSAEPLFDRSDTTAVAGDSWEPIGSLFPDTSIPSDAQRIEVQRGLITTGSQRLIESALTSYHTSLHFYRDLAQRAAGLGRQLRQPRPGDTVALFVADRHDNVGMDPVARAIGDAGGATILYDGGDDTSTGEPWESFSLDSVAAAFDDIDEKYTVAGNHDNGDFVGGYLSDRGFTVLDGRPVQTDEGIRVLGVADPRSSGLGSWRTTSGISFDDQADRLADVACRANDRGERVTTLLVHDANLGRPALDRGCVDLLIAGHLHTQIGPDVVVGSNGDNGVTFTNGTTGGAAYAVALGTKLRRDAEVTLITYRNGHPIGLQPVMISTTGAFTVAPYDLMPSITN